MRCCILYVMLLELILSGSVLSVKPPRCKKPSGKPGQTLVKSCTDKEVCTIDAKNKAKWQRCPTLASGDALKTFEADVNANFGVLHKQNLKIMKNQLEIEAKVDSKLNDMEVSLKDLFKQHLKIIRLLHVWRKVYGLNTAGGLFANLDEAKKKNIDDPEADLFSILYDLESMRNAERVFHFKLCYPGLASVANNFFPCNEWIQSSNPFTESTITGYTAINVTYNTNGVGGTFQGMGLSSKYNLIDASPDQSNTYYEIGSLRYWPSAGYFPGPNGYLPGSFSSVGVKIVEWFVLDTLRN